MIDPALAHLPPPVIALELRPVAFSATGKRISALPPTANAIRRQDHYAQSATTRKWIDLTICALLESYPAMKGRITTKYWQSILSRSKKGPLGQLTPRASSLPPLLEKATIVFIRHTTKEPDYDNLVRSFKFAADSLVLAGVIPDDSPKYLRPRYWWAKATRDNQHCSIYVYDGFADVSSEIGRAS